MVTKFLRKGSGGGAGGGLLSILLNLFEAFLKSR